MCIRDRISPTRSFIDNNWILKAYCDSDYSGDKDTRRSVTGYVIFIQDVPVSWKSRGQKSVTLSSTEAEYVALSEVCMEIMFVKQLLEFIGMIIKKPIVINVDNVGAIYLATNTASTGRTRHIDTRYHYVREYVMNGEVEVVFVRSQDNTADLLTKNLPKEEFEKHAGVLVDDIEELMRKEK